MYLCAHKNEACGITVLLSNRKFLATIKERKKKQPQITLSHIPKEQFHLHRELQQDPLLYGEEIFPYLQFNQKIL